MLTAIIIILSIVLVAFIWTLFHLLSEEHIKQHDVKRPEEYQCKACSYTIHNRKENGNNKGN